MWVDIHRSIKPFIRKVKNVKGAANYLAKYMHRQACNRYIMSAGWVFKGWVSWSKWYKENYGVYPQEVLPDVFARLAKMSKDEREKITLPELVRADNRRRKKGRQIRRSRKPLLYMEGVAPY